MKIKVLQENIQAVIKDLKKAVPSNPPLAVLGCILCNANTETGILLTATDLYIGIRKELLGQIEEPGVCAIPAKTFTDLILSLPPGEIEMSLEGSTLSVKTSTSSTQITVLPADEFPEFPTTGETQLDFETQEFTKLVDTVSFAASRDENRPVLTGILFDLNESTPRLVATDGFRLAVYSLPPQQQELRMLVPSKSLAELCRQVTTSKAKTLTLHISQELKQLYAQFEGTEIAIRLLDGDYPPYQQIMPEEFEFTVDLDAQELLQHLKTVQVFAREASNIVTFEFTGAQLKLSATATTLGQHSSTIKTNHTQPESKIIAFNVAYILDFLLNHKPKTLTFQMNDSLQPAQFTIDTDPNVRYIIMPFKLNQ